jgi:hypothetical protein
MKATGNATYVQAHEEVFMQQPAVFGVFTEDSIRLSDIEVSAVDVNATATFTLSLPLIKGDQVVITLPSFTAATGTLVATSSVFMKPLAPLNAGDAGALGDRCTGCCGDGLSDSSYYNETTVSHLPLPLPPLNTVPTAVRVVRANGIPRHIYHDFRPGYPGHPATAVPNSNIVCERRVKMRVPAVPKQNAPPEYKTSPVGIVGIATSGAFIYNHLSTAQGGGEGATLDTCGGHADPQCAYHYPTMSSCMPNSRTACSIIGYMRDGFPLRSHCDSCGVPWSTLLTRHNSIMRVECGTSSTYTAGDTVFQSATGATGVVETTVVGGVMIDINIASGRFLPGHPIIVTHMATAWSTTMTIVEKEWSPVACRTCYILLPDKSGTDTSHYWWNHTALVNGDCHLDRANGRWNVPAYGDYSYFTTPDYPFVVPGHYGDYWADLEDDGSVPSACGAPFSSTATWRSGDSTVSLSPQMLGAGHKSIPEPSRYFGIQRLVAQYSVSVGGLVNRPVAQSYDDIAGWMQVQVFGGLEAGTLATRDVSSLTELHTFSVQDTVCGVANLTVVTPSNNAAGGESGSIHVEFAVTNTGRVQWKMEEGEDSVIVLTLPGFTPVNYTTPMSPLRLSGVNVEVLGVTTLPLNFTLGSPLNNATVASTAYFDAPSQQVRLAIMGNWRSDFLVKFDLGPGLINAAKPGKPAATIAVLEPTYKHYRVKPSPVVNMPVLTGGAFTVAGMMMAPTLAGVRTTIHVTLVCSLPLGGRAAVTDVNTLILRLVGFTHIFNQPSIALQNWSVPANVAVPVDGWPKRAMWNSALSNATIFLPTRIPAYTAFSFDIAELVNPQNASNGLLVEETLFLTVASTDYGAQAGGVHVTQAASGAVGTLATALTRATTTVAITTTNGIAFETGKPVAIGGHASTPIPTAVIAGTAVVGAAIRFLTIPSTDFGAQAAGVVVAQAVSGATGTLFTALTGATTTLVVDPGTGFDATNAITVNGFAASTPVPTAVTEGNTLTLPMADISDIGAQNAGVLVIQSVTGAMATLGIATTTDKVIIVPTNGIAFNTVNRITIGGHVNRPSPSAIELGTTQRRHRADITVEARTEGPHPVLAVTRRKVAPVSHLTARFRHTSAVLSEVNAGEATGNVTMTIVPGDIKLLPSDVINVKFTDFALMLWTAEAKHGQIYPAVEMLGISFNGLRRPNVWSTMDESAMATKQMIMQFPVSAMIDPEDARPVSTVTDVLLGSASTAAGQGLTAPITASGNVIVEESSISSIRPGNRAGTGTGLTLTYRSSATQIESITVQNPGTGYRVGDVITIAAATARAVVTTVDALMGSASTNAGEDLVETITAGTNVAVAATSISTSGTGTGLALKYTAAASGAMLIDQITSIMVTAGGSDYQVGDTITIAAVAMPGRSTAAVFTLQLDDLVPSAMPGRSTDAVFILVEDDFQPRTFALPNSVIRFHFMSHLTNPTTPKHTPLIEAWIQSSTLGGTTAGEYLVEPTAVVDVSGIIGRVTASSVTFTSNRIDEAVGKVQVHFRLDPSVALFGGDQLVFEFPGLTGASGIVTIYDVQIKEQAFVGGNMVNKGDVLAFPRLAMWNQDKTTLTVTVVSGKEVAPNLLVWFSFQGSLQVRSVDTLIPKTTVTVQTFTKVGVATTAKVLFVATPTIVGTTTQEQLVLTSTTAGSVSANATLSFACQMGVGIGAAEGRIVFRMPGFRLPAGRVPFWERTISGQITDGDGPFNSLPHFGTWDPAEDTLTVDVTGDLRRYKYFQIPPNEEVQFKFTNLGLPSFPSTAPTVTASAYDGAGTIILFEKQFDVVPAITGGAFVNTSIVLSPPTAGTHTSITVHAAATIDIPAADELVLSLKGFACAYVGYESNCSSVRVVMETPISAGVNSSTAGGGLDEAITAGTDIAVAAESISTSGGGSGLALKYTSSISHITSVTVTAGGSGYVVGDTITIAAVAMPGRATPAKFTLVEDDLVSGGVSTVTDALVDSAAAWLGEEGHTANQVITWHDHLEELRINVTWAIPAGRGIQLLIGGMRNPLVPDRRPSASLRGDSPQSTLPWGHPSTSRVTDTTLALAPITGSFSYSRVLFREYGAVDPASGAWPGYLQVQFKIGIPLVATDMVLLRFTNTFVGPSGLKPTSAVEIERADGLLPPYTTDKSITGLEVHQYVLIPFEEH